MNTVLYSYGQLYGCPEILKKSYKFFCRGLDIRVAERVIVKSNLQFMMDYPAAIFKRVGANIFPIFAHTYHVYFPEGAGNAMLDRDDPINRIALLVCFRL